MKVRVTEQGGYGPIAFEYVQGLDSPHDRYYRHELEYDLVLEINPHLKQSIQQIIEDSRNQDRGSGC